MPIDFQAEADRLAEWMVACRRDLHRHPELGFQEVRTAGIVARELTELGLEVATGVARTGVIGMLEGDRPGPTILVRFDMDALPVQEANATDYVSTVPGKMHACGHDGHVTIGLAVARILAAHRADLAGRLKFVFQPAEEGAGGGETMVREGVLENPAPDVTLALHLWNNLPLGKYGVTDGPAMAGDTDFSIMVTGQGGHAALPHQTRDPIVAAAHLVTALQSLAARNLDPADTGVLSVTQFHAGTAFNVIPDEAVLRGTIRYFRRDVRDLLTRRMIETAEGVAQGLGCSANVEIIDRTPPLINDAEAARHVRAIAQRMFGAENVQTETSMGSEDMAFMLERVPGCYFFVGAANAERGLNFPHHNARFDFDEAALPRAAALMAAAAGEYVLP
jgi:amidohydrolase